MASLRAIALAFGTIAALPLATAPAQAQFFFKGKDLRDQPVTGTETDVVQALPGATPAELRAGLVWNMRAGLNVAALQCQFEPMLLTVPNYNAILADHGTELKTSFDTLDKYFKRTAGSVRAGQSALDQFGTRTYASFASVAGQRGFCLTAGDIGREALSRPRGEFGALAGERMRELRKSLIPYGEQAFGGVRPTGQMPRLEKRCLSGGRYNDEKCGWLTY